MQKLIQEEGSIQGVGPLIAGAGINAVFLITGKHFVQNPGQNFLQGLKVSRFIKTNQILEEDEIEIAYQQFVKQPLQAIVAIGGGNVIDLAKAIIFHHIKFSSAIPFFLAAPTTAGSGSEATHFAVIYKQKKKKSLANPALLPQVVVLDPKLTWSLSAFQTAVSGMDVLSQAVESYWNINATEESKQFATKSINLWIKYFPDVVTNPTPEARENMLYAAYLAGKAINITKTTGSHALSYYLTANHDVPHGQAVALFLPIFFLYNNPQNDLCSLLKVSSAVEAKNFILEIMILAGLATTLIELGIKKEIILDDLLDEMDEERFANNPAKFDREKLKELIIEYL